jgi:hypothetical protein
MDEKQNSPYTHFKTNIYTQICQIDHLLSSNIGEAMTGYISQVDFDRKIRAVRDID